MITSKQDLNEFLNYEFSLYFPKGKKQFLKSVLSYSFKYYIWKYVKLLRKCEFHLNMHHKIRYFMFLRRRKKLGLRLGFDISENCIDKGLRIFHYGSIIINANAKIGKNCGLVGNICIGNKYNGSVCPIIGDNVRIGMGAIVIGDVYIPNDCSVAAGAVVTRKFENENEVIIGMPAVSKPKC